MTVSMCEALGDCVCGRADCLAGEPVQRSPEPPSQQELLFRFRRALALLGDVTILSDAGQHADRDCWKEHHDCRALRLRNILLGLVRA